MGPSGEHAARKHTATPSAAGSDAFPTSVPSAHDAPSTGVDSRATTRYDASSTGAFAGHDALSTGVLIRAKEEKNTR